MNKIKIKKAVIPAAGLGTRFLPATKAMPKEMLPIVDKPTIQYIVEEAVASGIEEILIITSSSKNAIVDHFDYSYELEDRLQSKNKMKEFQEIRKIADMANIQYIRQKEPKGLGHAILCAKNFINSEPFAVLLGDDIVMTNPGETPALKQCIDAFNEVRSTIVGVQQVPHELVVKYGIINPSKDYKKAIESEDIVPLRGVIEKPLPKDAPSDFAILGRYILTPEIFDELAKTKPDIRDEIELTDAIFSLSKYQRVFAKVFSGKRFDIGSKVGFIHAIIEAALNHEDIKQEIDVLIRKYAHDLEKKKGYDSYIAKTIKQRVKK
ncbi:UTP--glucose-1-phosphate uridylyltransferase GalU [[Mycoplasma] testudinis]|uniref:UTP--glucose-1-phosphate uridylyltransferase GalU n=1 Tax=[Mycoplasma] testudinis TaxID=33924 RepID=UPI0004826980|nr:UTP--glucose-1-phosphate uridylyltransferase GalU [[Mycoplasma] testudinis]